MTLWRCIADCKIMRFMTSAMQLLLLTGVIMTLIDSSAAVKCYKCSSLNDEWCAKNASFVNGECQGPVCFEEYNANIDGS